MGAYTVNLGTQFANNIHPLTGLHQSTWIPPEPGPRPVEKKRVIRKKINITQALRSYVANHPCSSCYEVAVGLGLLTKNVSSKLSALELAGELCSVRGPHKTRRGDTKFYSIRETT